MHPVRIGAGERIAVRALDVGPFALRGGVIDTNAGRGGFCPRRTVLDKLLVDAAADAGADVREAFTVERLLWDGDRVIGISGHSVRAGASTSTTDRGHLAQRFARQFRAASVAIVSRTAAES